MTQDCVGGINRGSKSPVERAVATSGWPGGALRPRDQLLGRSALYRPEMSVSAIKVLFVTTEIAGLAKAGGLGEVSAGLPPALEGARHRCAHPDTGVSGRHREASRDRLGHRSARARGDSGREAGDGATAGRHRAASRRAAGAVRAAGHAVLHAGGAGLGRQPPAVRAAVARRGRYRRRAGGPWLGAGHRARERLAGRPDAGLYALGRHLRADGADHPQHRLPGQFRRRTAASARHSGCRVRRQRGGVPRPGLVPEGRRVLRQPRHHGQPDLCPRDHHGAARRRVCTA